MFDINYPDTSVCQTISHGVYVYFIVIDADI